MDLPRGLVESLGDDGPSKESPDSTDDESMLEQHLRAFKRALDGGKFAQAADSFKAAMDECSNDEEAGEGDADGPSETDEY